MNIREITEKNERDTLSKYAVLSEKTKGRLKYMPLCDIRPEFQRDRDRIIHSKSFRRLKHKTQVFITPNGDHYRTRLTHTLEVAQIGRTIARALRLNEDLAEGIALAHDLGHTPFGHAGEAELNEISPLGFKHYEQSLRVVDIIENGEGLNLTYEVRNGILNHTGDHLADTLEGRVIKFADRIAYINHDIDDAIRGGVLHADELPKDSIDMFGTTHSKRINNMILDVIENSMGKNLIKMSDDHMNEMMKLRQFMFDRVYTDLNAKKEMQKAKRVIRELYEYFINNKDEITGECKELLNSYSLERVVCDYIAGMTDRYAIHLYNDLFIPKAWKIL